MTSHVRTRGVNLHAGGRRDSREARWQPWWPWDPQAIRKKKVSMESLTTSQWPRTRLDKRLGSETHHQTGDTTHLGGDLCRFESEIRRATACGTQRCVLRQQWKLGEMQIRRKSIQTRDLNSIKEIFSPRRIGRHCCKATWGSRNQLDVVRAPPKLYQILVAFGRSSVRHIIAPPISPLLPLDRYPATLQSRYQRYHGVLINISVI